MPTNDDEIRDALDDVLTDLSESHDEIEILDGDN